HLPLVDEEVVVKPPQVISHATYGLALAVALSPAALQTGSMSCSGDTTLTSLEFEIDDVNQVAFTAPNRAYDLGSIDAPSAVLRVQSSEPTAAVSYQWWSQGEYLHGGPIGVGGGEVAVSVPHGQTTLRINVSASGGSLGSYSVSMCRCSEVPYDRTDQSRLTPFPGDYWLAPDPSTSTGGRIYLSPPVTYTDVGVLFSALMNETDGLDGFSPIGGFVIELNDEPDASLLPLTPQASVDPTSPLALIDLTPTSTTFGQRVPFKLTPVTRTLAGQPTNHCLVLYPSIALASGGRYAVVLTREAKALDGRPFGPSPFMRSALGPEQADEPNQVRRVRSLIEGVLPVLADGDLTSSPIDPADIALLLRVSMRSTDDIPATPLSMKAQIEARPAPTYQINSVTSGPGAVAAIIRGTWQAPNWREDQYFIARDANGDPVITGTLNVPFVLTIPQAASSGPVPIVMFQHGSPGSAEQVVWESQLSLSQEGFAVIGFTDTLNRELGQNLDYQNSVMFQTLLAEWRFPHYLMQAHAEQMSFLRLIPQLGALDYAPYPGGDGTPDIDLTAPLTYVGLSMGSNHGSGFLPYAPEIKAAALAAAAERQGERFFAGGDFINIFPPELSSLIPNATPADYWVGLVVFQMIFDHQDRYLHAEHLYRNPLAVSGTTRKASILLQSGLRDVFEHPLRSLAWNFGPIPHLEPIWEDTGVLEPIVGPVSGNIDAETTAAFYQFVPFGVPGIPHTPGCQFEPDGHFCVQTAPEARTQRALFLRSAVEDPVPTIVDPLSF
ncbi:MAG: hypothetical protein AAF436_16670, partial [Myxococcota bacterium]